MTMSRILGGVLAAAIGLGAAAASAAESIRFAVTDIAGLENLQREFGPFQAALAKATGYEIAFFPVSSRTAAVEAMNSKQVDFVLTGPAEYVVFRTRSKATPVIGWQRPDYFAQVVVMADSPYQTVADLKGKKVAFGDVGSTSTHLGPAQALADQGLKPGDYQPMNISRNVAVEGMIRGDIAAIGMNFTHLQKIRKTFPDHGFRVIARGRDLPDDILVAGAHVPEATVVKVRAAFVEHGKVLMTALVSGADDVKKYTGGVFLPKVSDRDYEYVRSMYRTIGVTAFDGFVGN